MSKSSRGGWEIFVGDTLIGIANYQYTDQPWFICDFDPTPEFENYQPTFDEYADLVNNPQGKADYNEFYELHIESLKLRLVPFGDVWHGETFVAQIYSGSNAWLRPI